MSGSYAGTQATECQFSVQLLTFHLLAFMDVQAALCCCAVLSVNIHVNMQNMLHIEFLLFMQDIAESCNSHSTWDISKFNACLFRLSGARGQSPGVSSRCQGLTNLKSSSAWPERGGSVRTHTLGTFENWCPPAGQLEGSVPPSQPGSAQGLGP